MTLILGRGNLLNEVNRQQSILLEASLLVVIVTESYIEDHTEHDTDDNENSIDDVADHSNLDREHCPVPGLLRSLL